MAVTANSIDLEWTAATDNVGVVSYQIFRSEDNISFTEIHESDGVTLAYTAIGLTQETKYYFKQTAKDAAGNQSTYGNTVTATTLGGVVEIDWDYTQMYAGIYDDDTLIQLSFVNEILDHLSGVPPESSFVVKVNDIETPVTGVSLNTTYVRLSVAAFAYGDEIKVSYTAGTNPLKAITTGNLVPNITDVVLDNVLPEPVVDAPVFKGVSSAISNTSAVASPCVSPSNLEDGDFMIAVAVSNDNTGGYVSCLPPEGWVQIRFDTQAVMSYAVFYKIADSGDAPDTAYGFVWDKVSDGRHYGLMYTYTGALSYEGLDYNSILANTGQQFTNSNAASIDGLLAISIYIQEDDTATANNSTGYTEDSYLITTAGSDLSIAEGSMEINSGESGGTQYYLAPVSDTNVNIGLFLSPLAISVDKILIQADENGINNTIIDLSNDQPRTTESDTAVANLISRGVTIITA